MIISSNDFFPFTTSTGADVMSQIVESKSKAELYRAEGMTSQKKERFYFNSDIKKNSSSL